MSQALQDQDKEEGVDHEAEREAAEAATAEQVRILTTSIWITVVTFILGGGLISSHRGSS